MMANKSIRFTLLVSINAIVILVLILTGWSTYRTTVYELSELFDAQLAQTARLLSHVAGHVDFAQAESLPIIIDTPYFPDLSDYASEEEVRQLSGHAYEGKIAFQVWDDKGQLVLTSANASDSPLSVSQTGYHDIHLNGHHWISFSLPIKHKNYWVFTAQRDDVRGELSGFIADEQLYPILLTWVPISVLVFWIISWVLKPIRGFSRNLRERSPNQLTPLTLQLPKEINPIQDAINTLFERVNTYVQRERRFIADASHELRTPLSVMRIHAENLLKSDTEEERRESALSVIAGTRRMSHLVNQLLIMARIEGKLNSSLETKTISIKEWVNTVLAEMPAELIQRVEWQVELPHNDSITGEPVLLHALLRNLLENAGKFTPLNEAVTVQASSEEHQVKLSVSNPGPELSEQDIQRLGERFYRHQAMQNIEGSGLGLSIVKRILELHRGEITFSAVAGGGLRVDIVLPQPR